MRVLHLDTGQEMRGGQRQALRLVEGLSREGVESTLLAARGSPLLRNGAEPLSMVRLARLARTHDLVHAHDSRSHTLAALVGGAPLIVTRRVGFGGRGGMASHWKYARAARYIAVSEYVKSILVSRGIPEAKIAVVYDGVPLLDRTRQAGKLFHVAPATDDPRKGSGLAAEAARLAGIELKLSADLETDLAHARSLVYITYSEGLGSAALLAMSAGVPVIASKVGGLPEIVRHRETGLLVENRPEAVAAAIEELNRDPELARRLGEAGRQAVIDGFTVEHMVRRTMEVYRRALA